MVIARVFIVGPLNGLDVRSVCRSVGRSTFLLIVVWMWLSKLNFHLFIWSAILLFALKHLTECARIYNARFFFSRSLYAARWFLAVNFLLLFSRQKHTSQNFHSAIINFGIHSSVVSAQWAHINRSLIPTTTFHLLPVLARIDLNSLARTARASLANLWLPSNHPQYNIYHTLQSSVCWEWKKERTKKT